MILILSEQSDITSDKVCSWLYHFQIPFLRINQEEHINSVNFVRITNSLTDISFCFNENIYTLNDFKIIWYRRGLLRILMPNINELIQLNFNVKQRIIEHLSDEKNTLINFIYYKLQERFHINNPRVYNINKLIVLEEAKKIGLLIPETIITNDVAKVIPNKELITKNMQDSLCYYDREIAFGQEIDDVKFDFVTENKFFYSLFQQKIKYKFEIRVFIFFEQIFAIANFNINNNSQQNSIRYVPFNLPLALQSKLLELLKNLSLESGSVDMLYDGENYIFLEVNPVGQIDYVSGYANYYIEKIIAEYLKSKYYEIVSPN